MYQENYQNDCHLKIICHNYIMIDVHIHFPEFKFLCSNLSLGGLYIDNDDNDNDGKV